MILIALIHCLFNSGKLNLIFSLLTLFNTFNFMLKVFQLSVFSFNSSKLFHGEGPTSEIAFCPMFILRKGMLMFGNLFLLSIVQYAAKLF